jgi:hypothetical protein
MIITIKVDRLDDPRFVETVARELRERLSIQTAPKIDVQYLGGTVMKF